MIDKYENKNIKNFQFSINSDIIYISFIIMLLVL